MMRSILLSISMLGIIAITGYAAQDNTAQQPARRGMGTVEALEWELDEEPLQPGREHNT